MTDIFTMAKRIETVATKPKKRTVQRRKAQVIIRRDGNDIKVPTRPKTVYPVVKPKKPTVNRTTIDAENLYDFGNYESWLSPVVRRRVLGKYIYERREELLRELVHGYGLLKADLQLLSYDALIAIHAKTQAERSKSLEVRDNSPENTNFTDGNSFGSIHSVILPSGMHSVEKKQIDRGINPLTDAYEQTMCDINVAWMNYVDENNLTDGPENHFPAFRKYCKVEIGSHIEGKHIRIWIKER